MVGTVQEDSGEELQDSTAVHLFRNVGEPITEQDLADRQPIIFQTGHTDGTGGQVATAINTDIELVYYTTQRNLQMLQPIPRGAGYH